MSRWVKFDLDGGCNLLPRIPGVYVVIADGDIVYIGQSQNVWRRFERHNIRPRYSNDGFHTPWGMFHSISVKIRKSSRKGDWLMQEYRLIGRLQPSGNCQHGPRKRSFNNPLPLPKAFPTKEKASTSTDLV